MNWLYIIDYTYNFQVYLLSQPISNWYISKRNKYCQVILLTENFFKLQHFYSLCKQWAVFRVNILYLFLFYCLCAVDALLQVIIDFEYLFIYLRIAILLSCIPKIFVIHKTIRFYPITWLSIYRSLNFPHNLYMNVHFHCIFLYVFIAIRKLN